MAFMWYASLLEDQDQQLVFYQKAVELDPRSAVAGYNVASILVDQGRDHEAMQLFGQIVDADPFYSKAYMLVGNINDRRGRLVEAITQMEKSYDLQSDTETAAKIAKLYTDVADFSTADVWISRVEQDPHVKERDILWLKVYRHAAEGDSAKTQPFIDQILQSTALTVADSDLRTVAAYFNRDYALAIEAFETTEHGAGQLMHGTPDKGLKLDAQIAAAFSYKALGQLEESAQLTSSIARRLDQKLNNPGRTDPGAWYRLALISAINGEEQMALNHLQRAIDEGWREHWKPGYEPAMQVLLSKQPFQKMLAGLETRMDIIRKQFEMEAEFAAGWSG
jgi:tetratricopeptide (TPR) repeat protein